MENFDKRAVATIVGKFDETKKAKACEWMQQHIGNYPPEVEKLYLKELYALSVMSVGLEKYGEELFTQLDGNGRMFGFREAPVRAHQTRDETKQAAHTATYKPGREAAHRAGLDVAVKIVIDLDAQHRVRGDVLKEVVNIPSNFRGELIKTNRGVDALHMRAHEGQDVGPFKKDERRRLRFIARFYQWDEFQTAKIKNGGEQLYSSIRSVVKSIDPSVWDAMHDKPQLQAPAVSAHLRMDGKPDGRYRENKGLRESELVPRRRVDGAPNIPAGQTEATRGTKPPVKAVEIPPTSTPVRLKKNGTPDLR